MLYLQVCSTLSRAAGWQEICLSDTCLPFFCFACCISLFDAVSGFGCFFGSFCFLGPSVLCCLLFAMIWIVLTPLVMWTAVSVHFWYTFADDLFSQNNLRRLRRQYSRTRRNCIKMHHRLTSVEMIKADPIGIDGFLPYFWRAGSSLSSRGIAESS